MPSTLDLTGLDRLRARFANLVNPDATPLMVTWMRIIDDDNRKGIMAGLDKDGIPMRPVTYRPKPASTRPTAAQKNDPRKGARRGQFAGLGSHPAGLHNNLSSAEYRTLAGPPLAPRGPFSRIITNLVTRFGRISAMAWEAVGYWDEVVSRKGERFLHYHFDGATGGGRRRNVTLPRRDLRGVRPEGVQKARDAGRNWMIGEVRRGG
jgi:hypothetical protein